MEKAVRKTVRGTERQNMRLKSIMKGAIAIAVAGAIIPFAGCAGGSSTNTSGASGSTDVSDANAAGASNASEGDLTKITFALDYVPNTNHTGIYVAEALEYYKDAGLEVDIVQPPDDGADAQVGSGNAQLGMSYQEYMAGYLGSANPLPVEAVAAVIQHNTSGIISRAGEGIDRPAGLAGHVYGTLDVDVEKAIVESIVESDGGDWSAVEVVPANSTDEVAGLRAGMFDAIWCFEGWAGQNAKLQDYPVDYFAVADIDDTFDYYTPVIIANTDYAEAHPDVIKAFLAATAKGYEYAIEHPEAAAEILVEAAPEIDPELALQSQSFLADKYIDDAPYWGYIDQSRWDRFYKWMSDAGLIDMPIGEGVGFTNEYLPQG